MGGKVWRAPGGESVGDPAGSDKAARPRAGASPMPPEWTCWHYILMSACTGPASLGLARWEVVSKIVSFYRSTREDNR